MFWPLKRGESVVTAMHRVLAATAFFFVMFMSSGCLIVPQKGGRIQAPSGRILQEQIDLGFLKEGVSRREVTARLGQFDVGFRSERLFIARWAVSTRWTVEPLGDGLSEHVWRVHTLFIEFDERDLVKRFAEVSDRELLSAIAAWTASGPPLTLSPPIPLSFNYLVLSLGPDLLQFEHTEYPRFNLDPKRKFSVQVADVRWIELRGPALDSVSAAGWVDVKMAFRKKEPMGRSEFLRSDMPTLITLVRFAKLAQIPLKEKSSAEKRTN